MRGDGLGEKTLHKTSHLSGQRKSRLGLPFFATFFLYTVKKSLFLTWASYLTTKNKSIVEQGPLKADLRGLAGSPACRFCRCEEIWGHHTNLLTEKLRKHERTGRPLGSGNFVVKLERN